LHQQLVCGAAKNLVGTVVAEQRVHRGFLRNGRVDHRSSRCCSAWSLEHSLSKTTIADIARRITSRAGQAAIDRLLGS
jgi:hypothetical protein